MLKIGDVVVVKGSPFSNDLTVDSDYIGCLGEIVAVSPPHPPSLISARHGSVHGGPVTFFYFAENLIKIGSLAE